MVERRVDVVEADPVRPHPLEALARQRQEPGLVAVVDRVLREQERACLEHRDHPVGREDARRDSLHVVGTPDQEAVPAALVARLGEVAPVRLGVDELEEIRPLVAAHLARAEVGVEQADELVAPHSRSSPPSSDASAATIRDRAASASASVSVRSDDWKTRCRATLLRPSGTGGPRYTSKTSTEASSGPPEPRTTETTRPAGTSSVTTTAMSWRSGGKLVTSRYSTCSRGGPRSPSTPSSKTATATSSPNASATSGCSSPTKPSATAAARPGWRNGSSAGRNSGASTRAAASRASTTPLASKKPAPSPASTPATRDGWSGSFSEPRRNTWPTSNIAAPGVPTARLVRAECRSPGKTSVRIAVHSTLIGFWSTTRSRRGSSGASRRRSGTLMSHNVSVAASERPAPRSASTTS